MAGHAERSTMFREVTVPAPASSLRWKAITICTGASASTLQDIKVPESCGGYSYLDSALANTNVRNRFIYWRTYQDVLELVEESLDMTLSGNMVRYKFQDTPVLPDITIHEAYGFVIVLVATVASVHRLVFPHPSRLQTQLFPQQSFLLSEVNGSSIFYEASLPDDPKNQHLLAPGGSITSHFLNCTSGICRNGEMVFTLATNTGGILLVKMPPLGVTGVVIQQELSCASMMKKLWTGLIPGAMRGSQQVGETVLSMELVALQGEYFIFTVCRDLHLRVWSTKTKDCILCENLVYFTSDRAEDAITSNMNACGHVIKSVQSKNNQDLCVYLSFQNKAEFVFLTPTIENGRLRVEHNTTIERSPPDDMVDFIVTEDCLATLWTSQSGETLVFTLDLSSQELSEWAPVYLNTESEVVVPQFRDPRDVYLEKIFTPGAFASQDIIKALSVYRRSPVPSLEYESLANMEALRNEVSSAIHNEIQNLATEGEMPEDDFTQIQLEQWEKFYSCCCQYKQVGEKAKGLFADPSTGVFGLIKKSTFSFLRPCDQSEELYLSPTLRIPASVIERSGLGGKGAPSSSQFSEELRLMCDCIQLISSSIPPDYASLVISCLQAHRTPDQLIGLLRDLITADREVLRNLTSTVSLMTNPVAAIEAMFSFLELSDDSDLDAMDSADGTDTHYARLFTGALGVNVLTQSFQQLVQLRFDFVRDLTLLLTVIVNLEQESGLTQAMKETLTEELIPKGHDLMRCYKVLVWAGATLSTTNPNTTLDYNLRKLSSLEITEGANRALARPISEPSYLIQLFIEGLGGDHTRERLASQGDTAAHALLWRSDVKQFLHALCLILWPGSDETMFPEFLVRACQYLRLQEYVHLMTPWCTWNEGTRAFFLGLSYLHFNEPHKALKLFVEASDGVATETFLSQKLLQTDEVDHDKLQILYYLKIIKQFEEHGLSDLVITMATAAINSADPDDPNLPTLQSKVFKQHLELGHNQEAYTAMMNNPDEERRKDCLRQFLVVLCERGNLSDLVNSDYQDLEEEVVYILENRARSVDLFTHDYYSLLFSFFICREDYRKAGRVMFERGLRLAQEVPGLKSLQQQAMCYLSALNTLRLVKPENAWIVKPVFPTDKGASGRVPKHCVDGHDKGRQPGPRKMEILELADLEREYLLLDARLRLIRQQPDSPLVSGPMPSVEEMLSLLCSVGLYDLAVSVTKAFSLPPDGILSSLSLRCVSLAITANVYPKSSGNDPGTASWRWLKENNIPPCGARESSPSDQAWSLLHGYINFLEDGTATCHKCVAQSLLSQSFDLPTWLVMSYKTVDVASLLRVYLTYDLLSQAASLAIEYLEAVTDALKGIDCPAFNLKGVNTPSPMKIWVPYTCIDQLLAALREQENASYSTMYQTMKTKLQVYQNKAYDLSRAIAAH